MAYEIQDFITTTPGGRYILDCWTMDRVQRLRFEYAISAHALADLPAYKPRDRREVIHCADRLMDTILLHNGARVIIEWDVQEEIRDLYLGVWRMLREDDAA